MRRLALLILLLVAVLQAAAAWAHASLVRSEPADGITLSESPATLRLIFNEAVSPLVMRLIGPNGETFTPEAKAEGTMVTIAAPPDLRRGTHVLSWRVVSADGHPLGGSLIFSVGSPSPMTGSPQTQSDDTVKIAIWL